MDVHAIIIETCHNNSEFFTLRIGGSFHSDVSLPESNVHEIPSNHHSTTIFPWFSRGFPMAVPFRAERKKPTVPRKARSSQGGYRSGHGGRVVSELGYHERLISHDFDQVLRL